MKIENLDRANDIQNKIRKFKKLKVIVSRKYIYISSNDEQCIMDTTDKLEAELESMIKNWIDKNIDKLEKEFEEL